MKYENKLYWGNSNNLHWFWKETQKLTFHVVPLEKNTIKLQKHRTHSS